MMRRLLIVIFLLALLCACGNRERYARLMAEADSLNQNYIPFTSDSTMKEVVDYYDHHGTANERMRAYYLLGCVYRDLGEAPHALECYHDAIDCADTTSQDCDYRLLGRIHGQMSVIFNSQLLPHDMLRELKEASRIAFIASDTMNAIISIERQAVAFQLLQLPDSVIKAVEHACSLYKEYGLEQDEATSRQHLIVPYIEKGNYQQAKKNIDAYEYKSGWINKNGDDKKRQTLFYYEKGLYYLGIHHLDSAEYFFRKQLATVEDLNSQEGGNRGLYLVYKQKNIPDSIAKYADISYQINDKRDMQVSSEEVSQIESMYNYSRNQRLAQNEQIKRVKVQMWLVFSIIIMLVFASVAFAYIRYLRRKRQQEELAYKSNLQRMTQIQEEVQRLSEQHFEELIDEKNKEIETLSKEIVSYQLLRNKSGMADSETRLISSAICQHFHQMANGSKAPSIEDWKELMKNVNEEFPQFYSLLNSGRTQLRTEEYKLCVLVRLHFSPFEICNIMALNSSNVSMMRSRLHQKIFGQEGNPKEFDKKIQGIV